VTLILSTLMTSTYMKDQIHLILLREYITYSLKSKTTDFLAHVFTC
jgi:hypothetical protein